VDVERLFTHRWRLDQAEEAYRLFDTQTTGKAVILPSWTSRRRFRHVRVVDLIGR